MIIFDPSPIKARYEKRFNNLRKFEEETGVSRSSASSFFSDRGSNPSVETLLKICNALDIHPRNAFKAAK